MMYIEMIERTRFKFLNIDCVRVKIQRVYYVVNIMTEMKIVIINY